MANVLAENLSEKAVMGSDGTELGTLYNITMDVETGRLKNLIVSPNEHVGGVDFEANEQGQYQIPVGNVQAVKDYIVVTR